MLDQNRNYSLVHMNYYSKQLNPRRLKAKREQKHQKGLFYFFQVIETKGRLEKQSGANRTEKRAKSMQRIECKGIRSILTTNRSICNKTKEMQERSGSFPVRNGFLGSKWRFFRFEVVVAGAAAYPRC